jgi:hypothetical protein
MGDSKWRFHRVSVCSVGLAKYLLLVVGCRCECVLIRFIVRIKKESVWLLSNLEGLEDGTRIHRVSQHHPSLTLTDDVEKHRDKNNE